MPLYRTGTRRGSIKHSQVTPPFSILRPESIPGHKIGRLNPDWHTFMNPNYMTPFNMYEMDLDGITIRELEEKIRTTYHIKNVTSDMLEAVVATLPNVNIIDEDLTAYTAAQTTTAELSQTPSAQSIIDTHPGPHAPKQFTSVIIEHLPGINDCMSGGCGPKSPGYVCDEDDAIVCSRKFSQQAIYMPFRILQIEELKQMRWLFKEPIRCCGELPEGFLITNIGLRRAFVECHAVGMQGEEWDLIMLGTLIRRGGMLDDQVVRQKKVIYVEDMVPIVPEEHQLYDKDYWDALYAQGHLWKEMPEIDTRAGPVEGAYWTVV